MANKKNNSGNNRRRSKSKASHPVRRTGQRGNSGTALARRDQALATNPVTLIRRFGEEMDRLFEDFGWGRGWLAPAVESGLDRMATIRNTAWVPQIEVFERGDDLVVRADLPGMDRDEVNVEITDSALTIRGERNSEHEENDEGYYRSERMYGSFRRRIPLPEGADTSAANANFSNGVLEITMPVTSGAERKPRQVDITSRSESGQARAASQR